MDLSGYSGIIFDMDGTLVDSGTLHEDVWQEILTMLKVPLDKELMRSLAGYPFAETVKALFTHFDVEQQIDVAFYEREKTRLLAEQFSQHVKPTPLFEMLGNQLTGLPNAVGTGSTTEEANWFLSACGLLPNIHHIVGCDKVKQPKPAPDTFLKCAELMRLQPERCLVFEDAPAGFTAAREAGMDVIDVADLGIYNQYFL